jgi:sugar/nucleoside kinase (ribokinase family)
MHFGWPLPGCLHPAQMMAALPYADIMFGNETEAAAFGEKMGWGSDMATIALVKAKIHAPRPAPSRPVWMGHTPPPVSLVGPEHFE